MRHLPLSALALVTLAGCATADRSDLARERPAIERTIVGYLRASVAGDGARACGYLSDRAQQQTSDRLARFVGPDSTCADALSEVHGHLTAPQLAEARRQLAATTVSDVKLQNDDHATAALVSHRRRTPPLHLRKIGDHWRIDDFAP